MAARHEQIAEGVWRLTGDLRGGFSVYFIADGAGVTMYDAGTRPMTKSVASAAQQLGGLRRIVLGHSHTDHRGTAPGLGVPVLCHPDEVADAEREQWMLDYWDHSKIGAPFRWIYPTLHRRWDGGPVQISDTVSAGDEIAGFEVIEFPGHAPGQIGLWRDEDGLALVSDTVYFADGAKLRETPPVTIEGVEGHEATIGHPAFNKDTAGARASLHKLADMRPKTVWGGHGDPLSGDQDGVVEVLRAGAERRFPPRARDDTRPPL